MTFYRSHGSFIDDEEHRFGAVVAAGIYSLFPENGLVLSVFGFFFSLPCFYYIVAKPEYATTGRFVLLTYNLTCLYACVCPSLDGLDLTRLFLSGSTYESIMYRYWTLHTIARRRSPLA